MTTLAAPDAPAAARDGIPLGPRRAHLVERAVEALGPRLGGATGDASPREAALALAPPPLARPATEIETPRPPPTAAATGLEAAPTPRPPVPLPALARAGLVAVGGTRTRLTEEIALAQNGVLRGVEAAEAAERGAAASRRRGAGGPEAMRRARVVLVTSARPGEGKSFSALNIAASIAAGGARPVVLVDADGKRGSLSEVLGVEAEPGLRALAADPALDARRLVLRTEVGDGALGVLTYGPAPADAPALPPGAALAAAVVRVADAMPGHVVVLDAPPCLATSEPSALAPVAGQVVLVVEAERTARDEIEAALDMVETCPDLRLLLNRTRLTASDSFGAYDGYGAYGGRASSPPDAGAT